MKLIKYFIQFLIISILFFLFKVLGLKLSSRFSKNLFSLLGPFFRSKKIINENILKAFPNLKKNEINKISKTMWENYGRILSEYLFLNEFRLKDKIEIKWSSRNRAQKKRISHPRCGEKTSAHHPSNQSNATNIDPDRTRSRFIIGTGTKLKPDRTFAKKARDKYCQYDQPSNMGQIKYLRNAKKGLIAFENICPV